MHGPGVWNQPRRSDVDTRGYGYSCSTATNRTSLDRGCTKANSYGRDIEPLVRWGDVVDDIVDCARKRDIDRIVISEHSRTELRLYRRSVPEEIALNCYILVTVIG